MEDNQSYGIELPTRHTRVPLGQSLPPAVPLGRSRPQRVPHGQSQSPTVPITDQPHQEPNYELFESGQAVGFPVDKRPPLPLREPRNLNSKNTPSKCHVVLVYFAGFFILALLVTVTVLLGVELSANRYQQLLIAEVNDMKANFEKSK